jgi:hypothetical protein
MDKPIEVDYHTKANMDLVYHLDNIEYKFAYNAMYQKVILTVTVHRKEVTKDYPVEYFLDLLTGAYYVEISKLNDISKRFKLIYDCKHKLLGYIERANMAMRHNIDPTLVYDFTQQIDRINSEIERLKVQLDLNKYDLEVKKLRLETRNYKEYLYIITACTLLFTAFFSFDKCKVGSSQLTQQNTTINKPAIHYDSSNRPRILPYTQNNR